MKKIVSLAVLAIALTSASVIAASNQSQKEMFVPSVPTLLVAIETFHQYDVNAVAFATKAQALLFAKKLQLSESVVKTVSSEKNYQISLYDIEKSEVLDDMKNFYENIKKMGAEQHKEMIYSTPNI